MASAQGRELGEIIATAIRSRRAAQRLSQESVAARMRDLGFKEWTRQTVGSTEKPTRRLTTAEAIGLAFVLEMSLPGLLRPDLETDEAVQFPTGLVSIESLQKLVSGFNDKAVQWKDDKAVFSGELLGWMGERSDGTAVEVRRRPPGE